MEAGKALAEVLLGEVNPSGKLPFTVPASLKDSPAHALDAYRPHRCEYKEGLLVGYRWFDAKEIEPDAAFGHGLSYTQFAYRDVEIQPGQGDEKVWVSLTLSNDGSVAGTEVVQLYAGRPDRTDDEPVRELKGFTKVHLKPGKSRTVTFGLSDRNLSRWDCKHGGWTVQNGEWEFAVGSSSRDLRLHGQVMI
jgi:beta-glucosidase